VALEEIGKQHGASNAPAQSRCHRVSAASRELGLIGFSTVALVAQVDKNSQEELQVEHDEQEADFGEELTPALARDYSKKLKDFSASLRSKATPLRPRLLHCSPPNVCTVLSLRRD
jgi:hypothetical protein